MTEPRGSVLVMAPSQAQPDPCVYCGIDKTRTRCAHQTQSMFDALAQVCRALEGFGAEDQRRILKACRILAAPVPPPLVFGDITKSSRPPVVDPTGRTAITYDDFTNAAAEIAGWATAEQRLDAKLAAHTPGDAMNLKPDEANVLRERAALVRVKPAFQRMVDDFSTDAANTVGEAMRRNVSHGAGTARQDQQLPDLHPGDRVWWRGVLRTVATVTADQNRGRYAVEFVEVKLAVQLAQREINNLRANYVVPHPDTIEWSTAPLSEEEAKAASALGIGELHRMEVRAKARRAIAMQAYRGAANFARCRRQCPHGDRCTREDGHKEDADINSTMHPPRVGCTLASCVCGMPTLIRHAVGCNDGLCLGCGDVDAQIDETEHNHHDLGYHPDRPLKTVGFSCPRCKEGELNARAPAPLKAPDPRMPCGHREGAHPVRHASGMEAAYHGVTCSAGYPVGDDCVPIAAPTPATPDDDIPF
jgi:hypothetical protein